MSVVVELRRIREGLVEPGLMSESLFEALSADVDGYEAARLGNPSWPQISCVAFVESRRPRLSFAAWAAIREIPVRKAEDVCARAGEVFGDEFFAFKSLPAAVPRGLRLGETLVKMGQIDESRVESALDLQKEIREQANTQLLLGSLLVRANRIDMGSYYQALSLHFDIDAERIDDRLLESIEEASVKRFGDRS